MKKNRFRTFATARVEIIEPTNEGIIKAKAALETSLPSATIKQKDIIYHILENKQEDLLYFKAVYATCGFNLNDDVFLHDEFWAARKTPALKPANWQHNDKEILGAIYAVDAQSLSGEPIDIENEKTPDEDYELIVYGVVYKYTFAKYAEEIEKRSKSGNLYVSMETWFTDYSYALLENPSEVKLIERSNETASLEKYLKCNGGEGSYKGKRIGRALRDLTFGGMGFVDHPANPRSGGLVHASEEKNQEIVMRDEIKEVVKAELDERAKAEALQAKIEKLELDNATAAENVGRTIEKLKRAEEAKALTDAILASVDEKLDTAIAGLGDSPPPEIDKIDKAEDKFAAKIAFLAATANSKTDSGQNAKIAELEAKVAEYEAEKAAVIKAAKVAARKEEIKELLGAEGDEDESVLRVLADVEDLDDAAYAARLETFRLVAGKSRPTLEKDGGQGNVEKEGASGEDKVQNGPRSDRQINVAASLENAVVEESGAPAGGDVEKPSLFQGLANLVSKKIKE